MRCHVKPLLHILTSQCGKCAGRNLPTRWFWKVLMDGGTEVWKEGPALFILFVAGCLRPPTGTDLIRQSELWKSTTPLNQYASGCSEVSEIFEYLVASLV